MKILPQTRPIYVCIVGYYCTNEYGSNPIFQANKHIGFDEEDGQGIDGDQFASEIRRVDSYNPEFITIYVNSLGGTVSDGFSIFCAIAECKAPVKVIFAGFAYSTAGWCFLSANVVEIKSYSSWMCHFPYDPENPDEKSEFLDTITNSIKRILSEKSGKGGKQKKTEDEIYQMMKVKTYMSPDKLYDAGLCDVVSNTMGISTRSIILNLSDVKASYKETQKVVNKFIENLNTNNIMAYPKVINKLQLAEGSSEDDIVAGIARIENKVINLERENTNLLDRLKAVNESQDENQKKMREMQSSNSETTEAMDKMKTEVTNAQNRIKELETENGTLAKEKQDAMNKEKEAQDAALRVRCVNLVKEYVDAGKILNEEKVIKNYEDMAFENFDRTEAVLLNMQTTIALPKPQNKDEKPDMSKKEKESKEGTPEWFRAQNRERIAKEKEGKQFK